MINAQDVANRVESLPPLPNTALRLMEVVNDPRSTMDDMVDVIRYDQSVTADVLKLCNSAYLGMSRRVTSLNDAILCLGTMKTMQVVLSVHANNMLSRGQRGYGMEPGVLWRHSVGVAFAASALAKRVGLPNPGLVFTAGLLHDIGKVILNEHVAEEFQQIVSIVSDESISFAEAEERVLGFSHAEVGGIVGERWQLPETLIHCIRYHHDPEALPEPDAYVDVVHLADTLCMLFGIGLGLDGLSYRADEAVMNRHHLTEQDLELAAMEVTVELKEVEEMFVQAADASPHEPVSR